MILSSERLDTLMGFELSKHPGFDPELATLGENIVIMIDGKAWQLVKQTEKGHEFKESSDIQSAKAHVEYYHDTRKKTIEITPTKRQKIDFFVTYLGMFAVIVGIFTLVSPVMGLIHAIWLMIGLPYVYRRKLFSTIQL